MGTLLVIVGPTGVGKTELALRVAERLGCPIVSCDSRQIYREIPIGTAAPSADELARVKHYFIGSHSVEEDYNAGQYERDASALLDELFLSHKVVVMTGGSMMYIDAVCKGLDDIPEVSQVIRDEVLLGYKRGGLAWLQSEVERLDPQYWAEVDRQNPQRLMHCIEVCRATGGTFTELRKGHHKERAWHTVKIGLKREREDLYERINRRVEQMVENGLLEEVQRVYPLRERNSLQTVGYRELFPYLEGKIGLEEAIKMIQQNSRHYAKRQMTWWNRDNEIHWLDAGRSTAELMTEIDELLK